MEKSEDWAGFSLFEDSGEKMENGFEATAARPKAATQKTASAERDGVNEDARAETNLRRCEDFC